MDEISNYTKNDGIIKIFGECSAELSIDKRIKYHPDVIDYIWIGIEKKHTSGFVFDGNSAHEPSFINVNLPVEYVEDLDAVEKLEYYPSYTYLSPKQRYKYLKFLENPFDLDFEIGYLFIFYYGLERYMTTEKYEGAIKLILRLLKHHYTNNSFISYAVEAVLFKAIETNKIGYINEILEIEKVVNVLFPPLRVYLFYISKKELTAEDVILLSNDVGWKKKTYLKDYKDLFINNLTNVINDSKNIMTISSMLGSKSIQNLETFNVCKYANISLDNKKRDAKIPNLLAASVLKDEIFKLMEGAHSKTKLEVSLMRKDGKISPKIISAKFKEVL